MSVRFSKDIEQENLEKEKGKWELYSGSNIVTALRTARELGWKDKKVQVRFTTVDEQTMYYVEPYEEGCGCRGIIKYSDYFD